MTKRSNEKSPSTDVAATDNPGMRPRISRNQAMAELIRLLRGSRNQKDVARAASLSSTSWSQYEKAHRYPRDDMIGRIASGLGLSALELEVLTVRYRYGPPPEIGEGYLDLLEWLLEYRRLSATPTRDQSFAGCLAGQRSVTTTDP